MDPVLIEQVLMITFGKYRPYIALCSGAIFIISGMLPAIIPAYVLIWILFCV